MPWIGDARRATAPRNAGLRSVRSAPVRRPAEILVERLRGVLAPERGGSRGGRRREVADRLVPREVAAGQHEEQLAGAALGAPVRQFLVHPLRRGGLGGEQGDEVTRVIQRQADRLPQMRRDGEIALIAKDAQRPDAVPRSGQALHALFERRGEDAVGSVAVRDEGVAPHVIIVPRRAPATGASRPPLRSRAVLLVHAGNRVDLPGRGTPRFPPTLVPLVRERVAQGVGRSPSERRRVRRCCRRRPHRSRRGGRSGDHHPRGVAARHRAVPDSRRRGPRW